MRTAGVREARHDFASLLDDVRKGREILITDRGTPVARLVPVRPQRAFPDLRKVRKATRGRGLALAAAVADDREDRA
jgi:prevent-host-death family protein